MHGIPRKPVIDRNAVADLLKRRLTNIQIAARLGCAPNTVSALKRKLGFEMEARKPRAPRPPKVTFVKPSAARKYSTERAHLALQIAEWPAGIRFEDADVPREPLLRGTPPAFGTSLIGNGSAMAADKLGFI